MNEVHTVLKSSKQSLQLLKKPIICLSGYSYPLLFGRAFAQQMAKSLGYTLSYQNVQNDNSGAAMASLRTTFLGQKHCYWLGSIDNIGKKQQQEWLSFLEQYNGPHILLFFGQNLLKNKQENWNIISLPEDVGLPVFKNMAQFFEAREASFEQILFRQSEKITLDTAYLFLQYAQVVGQNSKQFATDWLPDMIVSEVSLFALSQALFDRNKTVFFSLWGQMAHRYSVPFWTTFWSEQLWRAYAYIRFQKLKKISEAKKIGYRLPFSFLNRTWRSYSLERLKKAHNFLYEIDHQVKNGGDAFALDLFYAIFLLQ